MRKSTALAALALIAAGIGAVPAAPAAAGAAKVGYYCFDVFNYRDDEIQPDPWLESAGIAVAETIALMWESTVGPQPEPWRERALAALDSALRALRYQDVGLAVG